MERKSLKKGLLWKTLLMAVFLVPWPAYSFGSDGPEGRDGGVIRILAIGNSFSRDAVEQYLWDLADAAGIDIIVGNMYIGGCSLSRHLSNADSDAPAYTYRKIVNGKTTELPKARLSEALAEEEWDYISLQQVSGNSGQYDTFAASLPGLVDYVKAHATNPDVRLMLHQTWAYSKTSKHADFPKYDRDQDKMYRAIVDAVDRAAALVGIEIVIPAGTAVQNGRTSPLGDTFDRDGYHLNLTHGRYAAACTWFEKILGVSVVGNPFAPEGMNPCTVEIVQRAAHAAVQTPDRVTEMDACKDPAPDPTVIKTPIPADIGPHTVIPAVQ